MQPSARLQTLAVLLLAGCAWLCVDPATVRATLTAFLEGGAPAGATAAAPATPAPSPSHAVLPTIVVERAAAWRDRLEAPSPLAATEGPWQVLQRLLEEAARERVRAREAAGGPREEQDRKVLHRAIGSSVS